MNYRTCPCVLLDKEVARTREREREHGLGKIEFFLPGRGRGRGHGLGNVALIQSVRCVLDITRTGERERAWTGQET